MTRRYRKKRISILYLFIQPRLKQTFLGVLFKRKLFGKQAISVWSVARCHFFVSTVTGLHRQQQSEVGPACWPSCLGLLPFGSGSLHQVFNTNPWLWFSCCSRIHSSDIQIFLNRYTTIAVAIRRNRGNAPSDHEDEQGQGRWLSQSMRLITACA